MEDLLRAWLQAELTRLTRGTFRALADVPLPHPRSLSRATLATIVADPSEWTVAEKSDGVRAVLVRCVMMRVEYTVAVDRRFAVTVLSRAPSACEPGVATALDTERVGGGFVAHDVLVCAGAAVRQQILRTCVAEFGAVRVKSFVALERIGEVASATNADGLIFAKSDAHVTFGSEPEVLKWKQTHACTVDLLVERRKCGAHLTRRASARTADGRTTLTDVGLDEVGVLPAIWEFGFRDGKWVPLRERGDKSAANTDFVVEQTMLNIREEITLDELVALFGAKIIV